MVLFVKIMLWTKIKICLILTVKCEIVFFVFFKNRSDEFIK